MNQIKRGVYPRKFYVLTYTYIFIFIYYSSHLDYFCSLLEYSILFNIFEYFLFDTII